MLGRPLTFSQLLRHHCSRCLGCLGRVDAEETGSFVANVELADHVELAGRGKLLDLFVDVAHSLARRTYQQEMWFCGSIHWVRVLVDGRRRKGTFESFIVVQKGPALENSFSILTPDTQHPHLLNRPTKMANTAHMRTPGILEAKSLLDTPGGDNTEVILIHEDKVTPLGLGDEDDDDVEYNMPPANFPPKQFETVPRRTLLTLITWPFTAAIAFFRSRIYYNVNVDPTTTHRLPNYICALSAWFFAGVVAAWMSLAESATEVTPSAIPLTGSAYTDSIITLILIWRHRIYFASLVVTCFVGMADRRGGLPGIVFFKRHFNLLLQLGRVLTLLSMISTGIITSTLPRTCLVQISVLWMAGFVCKALSSHYQGYYYAICTFLWNNCTSGALVLMYLCNT